MMLGIDVIRFSGAFHSLGELRAPDALVLRVDQSLFAASWARLRTPPNATPVVYTAPGFGKELVKDLAVDNAWTIDPVAQQIALARPGALSFIDPANGRVKRTVNVPGVSGGTFGAVLDGAARRLLLIVMNDVNRDFAEYGAVVADLATGSLTPQPAIHGDAEYDLLWDNSGSAWIVGDTRKGSLWRCDGSGAAAAFAGPAGPLQNATFASTPDGVFATAVLKKGTASALSIGRLEAKRIAWSDPIQLSGPPILLARRHPSRPLWACLAFDGAGQQIQIRDADGAMQAVAPVRPPILLNKLQWSSASPDRLWALGVRALASATLI